MSQTDKEKQAYKAAMKSLRQQRKKTIDAAKATMKSQNTIFKGIKAFLKQGPRTVPEISQALAIPTSDVLWSVMSLKKYGLMVEGEQDGEYFKYGLADSDAKGGEA
ncbi:MAG: winged helix-turn-helix transcriptional regulator [Deltaproteobacteria bacterium]|jgi:hypothetical protein|nr:winged helix-turn-helix transcriptional regulator [Deltaproteobacteria bacterium]